MLLGIVRDAALGPAIAVGFGGVFVELLADLVYRLPPIAEDEAEAMLQELRGHRILDGARGRPPVDRRALRDAIMRLSWLAADFGDQIAELDVNPLIVGPPGTGACVVDGWARIDA
jgi:acyl-CoA synthetase (NDP forming)